MTSKQRRHAVLFTKENCGPCFKTKVHLTTLLQGYPELGEVVSVMAIENHSALREAYGLNLFPTLLVVDQNIKGENDEIERIVGGKAIREQLEGLLTAIHKERQL